VGVPAGKVRGVLEALTERGTEAVEHPTIGSLPLVPSPFGLAAEPPPLLGRHTREVLAEAGYAEEEVGALQAAGVIATSRG
jgi:crotonobetainyl-CoA:carnitine CoA-transferase CaiB-like acyl-CoA transferase